MRQSAHALVLLAVALALAPAALAVPVKRGSPRHAAAARPVRVRHATRHAALGATIPCDEVPAAFCTAAAGCKQGDAGVCKEDPSAPPVNCTSLSAAAGAGVAAAEKALLGAISGVKDTCWSTMQGTQSVLGKAADAMKGYDSALKEYNSSLVSYQKEVAKLDTLSATLEELKKNCSSAPTPDPACDVEILKMETEIAKQNGTCGIKWIEASIQEKKMDLLSAAVSEQDKLVAAALSSPAKVFSDAAAQITDAEASKASAVAFWALVTKACIAPTASATEAVQADGTRARVHSKH
jgi:hypothetical protein